MGLVTFAAEKVDSVAGSAAALNRNIKQLRAAEGDNPAALNLLQEFDTKSDEAANAVKQVSTAFEGEGAVDEALEAGSIYSAVRKVGPAEKLVETSGFDEAEKTLRSLSGKVRDLEGTQGGRDLAASAARDAEALRVARISENSTLGGQVVGVVGGLGVLFGGTVLLTKTAPSENGDRLEGVAAKRGLMVAGAGLALGIGGAVRNARMTHLDTRAGLMMGAGFGTAAGATVGAGWSGLGAALNEER